ncbi:MAG: DNA polymerase III subunit epsilon [Hyphomicrobiaceae bacterium]|nr:DNA polymerase III subunit epsilon [Hyphomicrobiaceae bacterium]
MREIVLDTETTGFDANTGDRIVEIGCVELVNHIPTGRHFHHYVNPERAMPEEAFRVHGLSDEFLADKPKFGEIAEKFSAFVGASCLIIHNAPFDMGFLNVEMKKSGRPELVNEVIDTVQLARKVHPGARVSLDALCKHYGIDNSRRTLHGALLDSEILAEVYLELIGGRQVALALSVDAERAAEPGELGKRHYPPRPRPLPARLDAATLAAHAAFVGTIGKSALWHHYGDESDESGEA